MANHNKAAFNQEFQIREQALKKNWFRFLIFGGVTAAFFDKRTGAFLFCALFLFLLFSLFFLLFLFLFFFLFVGSFIWLMVSPRAKPLLYFVPLLDTCLYNYFCVLASPFSGAWSQNGPY